MYLLDHTIQLKSRSDRVEIFSFFDCHIGKKNCYETGISKVIEEIKKHSKMSDRWVRVLLGGDQMNAINMSDTKRFDFGELADWFFDSDAETIRERIGNLVEQEVKHAVGIFEPIQSLILGALIGNHEKTMKTHQNVNVHSAFCERLRIIDLTDEALLRFKFWIPCGKKRGLSSCVKLYLRHGYGAGRSAGAEPSKLTALLAEWEDADVCLSGHSHTFCIIPPKPVLYVPNRGRLPKELFQKYRYAANPGCWLKSHSSGASTYESMACYPARPMMTLKIVIWPFWNTKRMGEDIQRPKIELREYPIL